MRPLLLRTWSRSSWRRPTRRPSTRAGATPSWGQTSRHGRKRQIGTNSDVNISVIKQFYPRAHLVVQRMQFISECFQILNFRKHEFTRPDVPWSSGFGGNLQAFQEDSWAYRKRLLRSKPCTRRSISSRRRSRSSVWRSRTSPARSPSSTSPSRR